MHREQTRARIAGSNKTRGLHPLISISSKTAKKWVQGLLLKLINAILTCPVNVDICRDKPPDLLWSPSRRRDHASEAVGAEHGILELHASLECILRRWMAVFFFDLGGFPLSAAEPRLSTIGKDAKSLASCPSPLLELQFPAVQNQELPGGEDVGLALYASAGDHLTALQRRVQIWEARFRSSS